MDFQSLKRRDLQALCKKNNIPANMTNAAMADALNSLEIVEGVEEFLGQLENGGSESPERYSTNDSRTSTRQRPSKGGLECSKLATRTRCGTRRVAIEGTDTRKTPATRTTRRRATEEASFQREMEKDLQAKFEEDLEQSQVSENSVVESTETSEKVSVTSVDQGRYTQLGSQNEAGHKVPEVNNDGEVVDAGGNNEPVVNEAQEESIEMSNSLQKVDYHTLCRKDLQNLCKRNKIPANMTNAAMADALGSLDAVEGLEEFLKGYDPLAMKSPELSRMTASRIRQAHTGQKTAEQKSARAGSALCKSLATKMEDLIVDNTGFPVSTNTNEGQLSEGCLEKSEFVDYVPENSSIVNALETGKQLHDETVENKFDRRGNEGTGTEMYDVTEEFEANMNIESNIDNHPTVVSGEEHSKVLRTEVNLQDDTSENAGGDQEIKVNISEKSLMQEESKGLDESIEFNDNSAVTETLESESDTNSSEKPDVKGLMQEAPALAIEGFGQSEEFSNSMEAEIGGSEGLLNTENLKQHGDFANEYVRAEEDSNAAEDITTLVKDDIDPKLEEDSDVAEGISSMLKVDIDPKPAADCAVEDEYLKSGSTSDLKCSSEVEVNVLDYQPENCQHEFEKLFTATGITDTAASLCPIEKPEGDNTEDQLSTKLVSEPATLAPQHAAIVKGTPLCHKSLRKLKRMLRDKLHETNLLAKKMERLTLEEEVGLPVGSTNSDVDVTKHDKEDLREGIENTEETFDGLDSTTMSGFEDAVASDDNDEESNDGLEMKAGNVAKAGEVLSGVPIIDAAAQCPINILIGNEGETEVDQQASTETKSNVAALKQAEGPLSFPLEITPRKTLKPLLFTPSKSSSHTPISAGRTNHVLNANKENIDDSATKTETRKVKVASAMSMGKLKKEVKVLLQQSDKKRPALQSRPDNQCPLANP